MAITLIALPYAQDALEPHISAQTLDLHHGAHHHDYVEKTNKAIAGTAYERSKLNEIVLAADAGGETELLNVAAQAWNHGFYWHSLSPEPGAPSAQLAGAIDRDFGSLDACRDSLAEAATDHFASGWAWLVADEAGKLRIVTTHDAASALCLEVNPLLTIDVWEHAYYLDVQSKRANYVEAVTAHCLNWQFASECYERGTAWRYPA